MDLLDLVNSFSTGSYNVTRRTAGGFSRGIALATSDAIITITASIQPARGQDLLRLPEGRRSNLTRVIFTTTELFTGDADATYEADLINVDGTSWEIQHVERWEQAGAQGIAYRCIAQQPTDGDVEP